MAPSPRSAREKKELGNEFEALRLENEKLRNELEEARQTLQAIQNGEVDALVVKGPEGDRIYSLTGSETPYKEMIEEMNQSVIVLSNEGIVVYINQHFADLLGVPLNSILGKTFSSFVEDRDRGLFQTYLVAAGKAQVTGEVRIKGPAGKILHLHLAIHGSADDSTEIRIVATDLTEIRENESALVTMVNDHARALHNLAQTNKELEIQIEERRKAEAELAKNRDNLESLLSERTATLRESEERYRRVVENTTAVILRIDPSGIINFANRRALDFFGYKAGELIGKHALGTIIPPQESSGRDLSKMMEQIIADPDAFHTNANENICKDGRRVWIEWTNSGIYGSDGHLKEILSVGIDATARKQAEDKLASAHRQIQDIIDNTPDIVYAFDTEERFVLVNKSLSELFNTTPDRMIGKRRSDFMPGEDAQWHEMNDQKVFLSGIMLEFEEYSNLKSRSITWLTKKFPLRDSHRNIYAVAGISADISERKQAEVALRESEQRLFLSKNAAGIGIHDFDVRSGKLEWDERTRDLFGIGQDEPVDYEVFISGIRPKDRQTVQDLVHRSLNPAGSHKYDLEYRAINRKDGSERWLLAKGDVIFEDEKPIRMIGVVQDITERKRAEEALRDSQMASLNLMDDAIDARVKAEKAEEALLENRNRLTWILDATGIGMWLNELPLGKLNWDNRSHELFFLPPDTHPTIDLFWSRIHPDDREPTRLAIEAAIRDHTLYSIDHRAVDPESGKVRWIHSVGQALYGANGTPVRFDGINYDITERKIAQERELLNLRETVFANKVMRAFVEHEGYEMFDHALAIVQEEMASSFGVFGYISTPGHLTCPSLSKMLDACEVEGKCIHYPPGKWKGMWAQALTEKRSLYTNVAHPVPRGHPVIKNNLATPILYYGEVIGLLNIANKDGDYTESDRDKLENLAGRISPVLYAWIQRKLREEERSAAEETLRKSREDLDRAQEVGQIGWWRIDTKSNFITWSEENHRIFGVPISTTVSYDLFLSLIHPDDRDRVIRSWNAALEGEDYNIEHRICVADRVKWVREKAFLEFDKAGNTLEGFGITQDITERKNAEESLKASISEKEILLKEIHHRVKNNMQVISSLVSLQAEETPDPNLKSNLMDVGNRVRSMAVVHEKLYQSPDLSHIDFADYARSVLKYLYHAHRGKEAGIKLTMDLETVWLPINEAIPCGLILNELASNSLKHAFIDRSEGEISVSIHSSDPDKICLTVKDDGKGMPEDLDWRETKSLGLRLVQMLSAQLKADVETSGGPGTRFKITFGGPKR